MPTLAIMTINTTTIHYTSTNSCNYITKRNCAVRINNTCPCYWILGLRSLPFNESVGIISYTFYFCGGCDHANGESCFDIIYLSDRIPWHIFRSELKIQCRYFTKFNNSPAFNLTPIGSFALNIRNSQERFTTNKLKFTTNLPKINLINSGSFQRPHITR